MRHVTSLHRPFCFGIGILYARGAFAGWIVGYRSVWLVMFFAAYFFMLDWLVTVVLLQQFAATGQ